VPSLSISAAARHCRLENRLKIFLINFYSKSSIIFISIALLASGELRRRFQFFFTQKNLTKKLVHLERSRSVGLELSLVYVQVSPTCTKQMRQTRTGFVRPNFGRGVCDDEQTPQKIPPKMERKRRN
jgi:hypothetical protein